MDSINVTGRDDRVGIYRSSSTNDHPLDRLVWNS